jgi:hypothetical protein
MIRVAIALAMLVVASRANAAPVTHCKPGKGAPIFEARWRSGGAKVVTKLYASGMWTRLATATGDPQHGKSGCIEAAELDEIKAALKTVKWKKTKAQERCFGGESSPVDFYAGGQKRYTRTSCGGTLIDEATAKLIGRIEKHIPDGFENPVIIDYEEI